MVEYPKITVADRYSRMSGDKQNFHEHMQQAQQDSQQLPEPDEYSRNISRKLQGIIREEITANGGRISFEYFMQLALYEPGLGYYAAGSRKFGIEGDFITSPEISPLFSYCLANFCKDVLSHLAAGNILEFGAGSGIMAADILLELERQQALPEAYFILEVSAELQQRQRQTLQDRAPHLWQRVEWLQQLPAQPFNGVVLANELLDAMPVERFYMEGDAVKQWCVSWSDTEQAFVTPTIPAPDTLQQQVLHIQDYLGQAFSDGYESELSLAHAAWLESVSAVIGQGVFLLIDYGYGRQEYYHPERSMGTLMCHYRHRAHPDPFKLVGLQDITAYVDFTTLAEAAVNNKMDVLGYTSQAGFLLGCGLEAMLPDPQTTEQQVLLQYSQQIKTLTLPGEMGERFKVMAIGKQYQESVPGFAFMDQLRKL